MKFFLCEKTSVFFTSFVCLFIVNDLEIRRVIGFVQFNKENKKKLTQQNRRIQVV
jgi:hypothetical protein